MCVSIVGLLSLNLAGCSDAKHQGLIRSDTVNQYSVDSKHQLDTPDQRVEMRDTALNEPDKLDSTSLACRLLFIFPDSSEIIRKNERVILSGDDHCVLQLLDTIVAAYVSSRNNKYMTMFDSLCQASDGYVADYMNDLSGRLFVEIPEDYLAYTSRRGKDNVLTLLLVQFFELRKENYESYRGERKDLQDKIRYLMTTLPAREKQYLRSIIRRSGFPEQ